MGQFLQNARTEIVVIDRSGFIKCKANTSILIFSFHNEAMCSKMVWHL